MKRLSLLLPLLVIAILTMAPVILVQDRNEPEGDGGASIVIVTPHNEQIRYEFARGFSRWHKEHYGVPVNVSWSTPGGTSEIRRMLIASYEADLRHGSKIGGDADILFGGGSYEFRVLSRPIKAMCDGKEVSTTILAPCPGFTAALLAETYGENLIDGQPIYDPNGHWFGAALSTFGIIANTGLCDHIGIPPPGLWQDLANPKLFGLVALVNPSQSGSIATAFETVLQRLGWVRGWQVLRRAAANSNQILAASSRIPTSVGNGDSAVGIAIDFYGRYQAQALADEADATGDPSIARLVFTTPKGQSVVDADPVALLRGAPNPDQAKHFIEYCLSMQGQALWQLAPGDSEACGFPRPNMFALRRLPVRRAAYECCESCFIDRVNPYDDQIPVQSDPSIRDFVSPLFVAMAVNLQEPLKTAWHRIITHPAYPNTAEIVTAEMVTDPELKTWLTAFDAMPSMDGPNGSTLDLGDPATLKEARAGWLKGGFRDAGLWGPRDEPAMILRRECSEFFNSQYESIMQSDG